MALFVVHSLPNGTFDLGGFPQGFGVGNFGIFNSLRNIGKSLSFSRPQFPSLKFNTNIFLKLANLPSLNGIVCKAAVKEKDAGPDCFTPRLQMNPLSWS
jgi:hypothetical protein